MARTIQQIQQVIIDEKNAQPTLNSLNSPSQTAIWNTWAFIIAVFTFVHETLWDQFQAKVNATVAALKPGTPQWYVQQMLNFQYGDTLEVVKLVPQYALVDATKQIVKYAAIVEEANGIVVMKAAAQSGGLPVALTTPQLNALIAYMNDIAFAGTIIQVLSINSDKFKVSRTLYYNPLVDVPTLLTAVQAAINNYLNTLQFNGIYDINNEIAIVRAVPGVSDYTADLTQARIDATPTFTTVTRTYQSLAGYLAIDPSFPLSTSIATVPSNV